MHCYIGYKLNYEADTKFLPIEILVIAYGLYYQELINLKWKFFSEVELHYRDLFHGKIYEVLLNLTSGIK